MTNDMKMFTQNTDYAKKLLDRNIVRNRPTRPRFIKKYADDMLHGRWVVNGTTIKITPDGYLIDGQHRLSACVLSGCSVEMTIAFNVPNDVLGTIDTGAARTPGNTLHHAGISNANVVAAIIRWVFAIRGRKLNAKKVEISHTDMVNFSRDNDLLQESANIAHQASTVLGRACGTPAMTGAFHYVFKTARPDEANKFFIDLIYGAGLSSSDPVLLLRNSLIRNSSAGIKTKQNSDEIACWFVRAWNARVTFRYIKILKGAIASDDGTYVLPEIEL